MSTSCQVGQIYILLPFNLLCGGGRACHGPGMKVRGQLVGTYLLFYTMGFWEIKLKSLSTELSHQAHFAFLIQSLKYPSLVLNLL